MHSRGRGRPSQVRPRPPSTGRHAPVRTRPVAPSPARLAPHRRIERRRGLPIGAQALLVVAIVALGATVLWAGSGGVGWVVGNLAGTVGGLMDDVTATPTPSATPRILVAAPTIVAPVEPYTNAETTDLTVTVPSSVVGDDGYLVRVYVTLPDQPAAVAAEAAVGPTSTVTLRDVALAPGRNDFHATLDGPGGESDPSDVVTWHLDQVEPKVTLTAPTEGAVVNRAAVKITGKTQGRSTIVARNEANGATATTSSSGTDGTFELTVPLRDGTNGITLSITDPAGNRGTHTVTVRRGSGVLRATLSANAYRFRAARLPDEVRFVVTVTDPDGRPLPDADVLFTIQVPGLEPIVSPELTTGGDGTASFRTRIAAGATPGTGLATVLVETREFGTITDRQVLTVIK